MRSETDRMDAELDSLRQLASQFERQLEPELVINDPSQYAIVRWPHGGEVIWDVHLPEGNRYVVKLATRGISENNFPETEHFVELAAGRHAISLEKNLGGEEPSAIAIVDRNITIQARESSDWYEGYGGSNVNYYRSTQAPCDKPLELTRDRFYKLQRPAKGAYVPPEATDKGVLLSIERKLQLSTNDR
jgi:hypothetical protein